MVIFWGRVTEDDFGHVGLQFSRLNLGVHARNKYVTEMGMGQNL